MNDTIFWSATLRFLQALFQASPTILVGLFVAGVLRRLLGPANTRRLFGDDSWRSLLQAWLIGMLLPVCSLGVIPVVREMRRAGVPGGTILAFALAAPLFNPLSLLYGLTLSEPFVILAFAACSLAIVTATGLAWDRLFPGTAAEEPAPASVPFGLKRLLSILVVGWRELAGPSLWYMGAGLLGVALLAACLPPGSLQRSMNYDNPWAPVTMTVVALPAYATPMIAMSQLGSMFQHGNSIGAAFALLTLGAGMNVGLLAWMIHSYGWKRSAVWIALLVTIVLGLSYGIERPLYPTHVEAADHTHAFDIYCQPFHAGEVADPRGEVQRKLSQDVLFYEFGAAGVLGVMLLLGLGLKLLDRRWKIEDWLERPAATPEAAARPASRWDWEVPAPVLGLLGLLGLIAFSVVGCYAFYPPVDEVFEELRVVRSEALVAASTGDHGVATHWIEVWDDWTRKLQVGVYLRRGELSDYHRMKAKVLREKLELLEHEVEEQDAEAIRRLSADVMRAHRRLHYAYTQEL